MVPHIDAGGLEPDAGWRGDGVVEAESYPMTNLMEDMSSVQQPKVPTSSEEAFSPRSGGVGQYFSWFPGRGGSSNLPDLEAPLIGTRRDSFNESDVLGPSEIDGVSLSSDRSAGLEEPSQASGYLFKVTTQGNAMLRPPNWSEAGADEIAGDFVPGTPPRSIHTILERELESEQHAELPGAPGHHAQPAGDTYAFAVPSIGGVPDEQVAFKSLALPSDITGVTLKASDQHVRGQDGQRMPQLQFTVQRRSPVIGYVLLVLAIWGVSALGAGVRMLGPIHPILKSLWRCEFSLLIVTPWLVAAMLSNPHCFSCLKDLHTVWLFFVTAVSSAGYAGFFVMSLGYTNMATSFLLGNCHSLLIVGWRLCTGGNVSFLEGAGVFIGLSGAAVTVLDKEPQPPPMPQNLLGDALPFNMNAEVFGAVLALISGIFGAIYITSAGMTRPKMEFSSFMWLLFLSHSILYTLSLVLLQMVSGHPVTAALTMGADPQTGFFGWTSPQNIRASVMMGPVGTIFGMCCYIAVMKYLDSVVVSVAMLSEPFVGVATGVLLHVSTWPGVYGWIGSIVSVFGALTVILGTHRKSVSAIVSQHQQH